MFKPGSIRKIQVKDFVTYSFTELYPGPNLNLLIGPNGTGKSTMVAAIILGLGGTPKIVGRGTKISQYVRHHCDSASIHIYLQSERENRFIKITREFDTREKTTWKINNEIVSHNHLINFVQQFNIQVNNLCQFLPQDRVQDFAKLDKKELLRETQRALCREDLIEKQQTLVQSRGARERLVASIAKNTKEMQEAQDNNVRLEGRVQNFNKKKKYSMKIEHIDRKIAWLQFEDIKAKVDEIKEDKKKAAEVYENYKKLTKPMEKEIDSTKGVITEMQQRNGNVLQKVQTSQQNINKYLDKLDSVNKNVKKVNNDTVSEIEQFEQKSREMETLVQKLEDVKKAKSDMIAKLDLDADHRNAFNSKLSEINTHKTDIADKKHKVEYSKDAVVSQIRMIENEARKLENIKQLRLKKLQETDMDAYTAVLWLRENKHLFKHEIFEPIMLELNVLDPKNAVYIENVVPVRDRIAFICVDKTDMNNLIRHLRQDQKLVVNVICSENSRDGLRAFQPAIPIEHLKKYGLYAYLHSLVTAPEPIMQYLCKTYRIHRIPIGNNSTNDCAADVPPQISLFFSDTRRYVVSHSKYTGQRNTKQIEIKSDGGFSFSVDIIRLENLKGQRAELARKLEQFDQQIHSFDSQVAKLVETSNALRAKLNQHNAEKQELLSMGHKINFLKKKIEDFKALNTNMDSIRQEGREKIKRLLLPIADIQKQIQVELANLTKLKPKTSLNSIKIENHRKQLAVLEDKIRNNRQLAKEAEETLNNINNHYSTTLAEAKTALKKAKNISNGATPTDAAFEPFKEVFDNLPNDIEELLGRKEHITSRMDCLNTAHEGELKEYEDNVKLMEELQLTIETSNNQLINLNERLEALKTDWLVPLGELIVNINHAFSAAFERMGCAGEVSICTGENDTDYAQYGVSIKVTYRSGEPLQELNRVVQSGGERAVATAVYMLSLQELTPVPFRCVDEINQGMDAQNERRIFELLVESTGQANTAQYFFITPKLLPNLNFSESMLIHIVHNGPFVVQDNKWTFSKLCNPQGVQIH